MPTNLVVMALEAPGMSVLCHIAIRPARGDFAYQAPSLPQADQAVADAGMTWRLGVGELVLRVWQKRLDGAAEKALHDDSDAGRISLPVSCPFWGGQAVTGQHFGPLPVFEKISNRPRCAGAGLLSADGLIWDDGVETLAAALKTQFEESDVINVLKRLGEEVSRRAGRGDSSAVKCPLGILERMRRAATGDEAGLFDVRIDKSQADPSGWGRGLLITRIGPVTGPARLMITTRHFDCPVSCSLIEFQPGVTEIRHDAGHHVTNVELAAFDEKGTLLERTETGFIQHISGATTIQSGADPLPPIRGAAANPDLELRARLSTDEFPILAAEKRGDGLETLWKMEDAIGELIGPEGRGTVRWFENSSGNQSEVVSFIKALLEDTSVKRATLADPYLGKEAFERVIIRHGRQDLDLTILISPSDIDPDAETLDVHAETGSHVAKLSAAIAHYGDLLCGTLQLLHLVRGSGGSQAFHDRYLVVWDRSDTPRAFLLSNSLNQAAGTWPFAIVELDRQTSHAVARYLIELEAGRDRDRSLTVERVWPPVSSASDPARLTDEHRPLLLWMADFSEKAEDAPLDDRETDGALVKWLASQSWIADSAADGATDEFRSLLARRWDASPDIDAEAMATRLAQLAEFRASTELSFIETIGPLVATTLPSDLTRHVLARAAALLGAVSSRWDKEAQLLFGQKDLLPATCTAALACSGRFRDMAALHLIAFQLQVDPLGVDTELATGNHSASLKALAMDAALRLCYIIRIPGMADRFATASSPGLRLLSLLDFDCDLNLWERRASAEPAADVEAFTLRLIDISAARVRASGFAITKLPEAEWEQELQRREDMLEAATAAMASGWPTNVNIGQAAHIVWTEMWDKIDFEERVSNALREAGHEEAATCLDALAASHVLNHLPKPDRVGTVPPPAHNLVWLGKGQLRRMARIIAASEAKPTDFVRSRLNPLTARWADAVDADLLGDKTSDTILSSLATIIIALQIALSAVTAKPLHRSGLASDYLHLVGRFLRSEEASWLLGSDLDRGMMRELAEVIGELRGICDIEDALDQMRCDVAISETLKERLGLLPT